MPLKTIISSVVWPAWVVIIVLTFITATLVMAGFLTHFVERAGCYFEPTPNLCALSGMAKLCIYFWSWASITLAGIAVVRWAPLLIERRQQE